MMTSPVSGRIQGPAVQEKFLTSLTETSHLLVRDHVLGVVQGVLGDSVTAFDCSACGCGCQSSFSHCLVHFISSSYDEISWVLELSGLWKIFRFYNQFSHPPPPPLLRHKPPPDVPCMQKSSQSTTVTITKSISLFLSQFRLKRPF